MSRIADPIDTGMAIVVSNRPRGRQQEREGTASGAPSPGEGLAAAVALPPPAEAEPPALPDPPGTTFIVALAAEVLPPVPPNPVEVSLRTAGHWSPPESGQRLTDRKV